MSTPTPSEEYRNKIVHLGTPKAVYLESRVAIANDLKFVMEACKTLCSHLRETESGSASHSLLSDALWTSVLIAYVRCFESGKRVSLQDDDVRAIDSTGGALELHRYCKDMRNKHLAHSVNAFETVKVGAALASEASGVKEVEGVAMLAMRHANPLEEDVEQFGRLAAELRNRVVEECNALASGEVLAEARQINIDELYNREEMRVFAPGPEDAGTGRP